MANDDLPSAPQQTSGERLLVVANNTLGGMDAFVSEGFMITQGGLPTSADEVRRVRVAILGSVIEAGARVRIVRNDDGTVDVIFAGVRISPLPPSDAPPSDVPTT